MDDPTRQRERIMLGLRLDEPLSVEGLASSIDAESLDRLQRLGLVVRTGRRLGEPQRIGLTRRGRFVGGGVTADLLAP